MTKKILLSIFLVAGWLILLAPSTQADTLTFSEFVKFSDNKVSYAAVVTITDIAGGVEIKMDVNGLPPGSKDVTGWWFNEPGVALTGSNFNYISGAQAQAIILSGNSLKPDGDGTFDIMFDYSTSTKPFGDPPDTYQTSVYQILATGLTASNFNFQSHDPTGGQGDYFSAIKNGEAFWGSGTATVPEPSTMLLLGFGLVGLWGFRRKFKK